MESTGRRRRGHSFHEEFEAEAETRPHDHRTEGPAANFDDDFDLEQPLDPTKLEDGVFDYAGEELDTEAEELAYSRGRSRSRSMHECDGDVGPPNLSEPFDPTVTASLGSRFQPKPCSEFRVEKQERTGPLQHREVLALKKGLEEATSPRPKDEILEEEEERLLAENEKKSRSTSAQSPNSSHDGSDVATRRVKVLMLGDSGVGKSSLILRWTSDKFSPTLVGTVGVNFKTKRVSIAGETVQVQVWDTAGQEHFRKITQSYYKGANGIMLIYDVTDPQSLSNVEHWIKSIKQHASASVHVILVGNKTDLRGSFAPGACVDHVHGSEVARRYEVPYYETSAKDSVNVDEAFVSIAKFVVDADTSPALGRRKSLVEKVEKGGLLSSLRAKSFSKSALSSGSNSSSTSSSSSSSSASSPPTAGGNNSAADYNNNHSPEETKDKCTIS